MLLTPKKWPPPTPPPSRVPVKLFVAAAIIAIGLGWWTVHLKSANQENPPAPGSAELPPVVPPLPEAVAPAHHDPVSKSPGPDPESLPAGEMPGSVPSEGGQAFWDAKVEPGDLTAVDALLRKELEAYRLPKELQPLFKEENLALKLVGAIDQVAGGGLPGSLLVNVKLPGIFKAKKDPRSGWVMAAENALRSVQLVDWLSQQDAVKLAESYHRLEPGLEAVYRSEFAPAGGFRQRFHLAGQKLLATPQVPAVLPLKPQGAQYLHGDPVREALPPIQKLIIRSGKTNADRFRDKLDETMKAIPVQP
jgi:hypothetical protein